jgi:hypothetical protein
MGDAGAFAAPFGVPGQHDMLPARQRTGQALERFPAHDHRGAHGRDLEPTEVRREVPGKCAVLADHAVVGAGDDDFDPRAAHTATSALMCGCGS